MKDTTVDSEEPDDREPEEMAAWLAAGFDPEAAEGWRRWRFTIARAHAWIEQGVEEGLSAAQWQTAGATPETVADWQEADIDASEAVHWHELGFSLAEARVNKRHGHSPVDAFQATSQRPITVRHPGSSWFAVGSVQGATGFAGVPGGPIHFFRQSGVDPRVMQTYLQRGWTDDEAVEWARHGVEAQDAYTWFDLGLHAVEAGRFVQEGRTPGDVVREWWDTGIPFEELADFIGAGLNAAEAVAQRAAGITAEHAASLRALRLEESEPSPSEPLPHALVARTGPPRSQVFGPPPPDEKAARAAVEDAYAHMMAADESGNVGAVDGGTNLGQCLIEARERHRVTVSDDAPDATVTANVVRFVNDHEARVLFTITVGAPLNQTFGGRTGRAVLVDGAWKVARETFCEFMQMAGVQCPPRAE
jgi:hypothetical protein